MTMQHNNYHRFFFLSYLTQVRPGEVPKHNSNRDAHKIEDKMLYPNEGQNKYPKSPTTQNLTKEKSLCIKNDFRKTYNIQTVAASFLHPGFFIRNASA